MTQVIEDFETYLARIRAESAARKAALGDMSQGGILKASGGSRWAFVLPDVSTPGGWRLQYFDEKGFSGHACYRSADECVESALSIGYDERDDGALDRAQGLPSFWRGVYATELCGRINARELTYAEGDALMAQYDAEQARQGQPEPQTQEGTQP